MTDDLHNIHVTVVETADGFVPQLVGQKHSDQPYVVIESGRTRTTLEDAVEKCQAWAVVEDVPFDDPTHPTDLVNPEFHGLGANV